MNNNVQTPRSRAVLVGLCVAVLIAWAAAVYMTYQDSKMARYDVTIKPGAVSLGTHSTVTMPPMTMPTVRRSAPMISGDAVRGYAHHGHATMPSATSGVNAGSGFRMHTTSSATVHSIGGGGNAGGGMMGASSSISSSRGIRYSGGSVMMPTLAMATPSDALQSSTTSRYGIGPRKAKPTGDGTYGQWSDNGAGDWWYYDGEDWRRPLDGETRSAGGGNFYKYDAGTDTWILVDDKGNPIATPVGDAPWWLMLCCACAYMTIVYRKNNKTQRI